MKYFIEEFDGVLYPRDKELSDYRSIYFNLPKEYSYIEIEYSFEKEKGCIIDIGVFDPQNIFRGWSGSSKQKIYISETSATPGYIAGEINSGIWTIILGLAKVVDSGCRYRVVVKAYRYREDVSNNQRCLCKEKSRRSINGKWVKGDLHIHTIHSDGKDSLCEVVNKALNLGLDYIAITDHNTISQLYEINTLSCSEILVIPGIEISTYYGHINTWGMKWFDFRRKSFDDFKNLVNEISQEGLIVSLNHPFNFDENCIGCDFRYKDLRGFNSIEVWNGPTPTSWNMYAVIWWHKLLSEGLSITAVGGSDYHGSGGVELATPTTWVYTDNFTIEGILQGIKEGKTFISRYPSGPTLDIKIYQNGKQYIIGDRIKGGKASIVLYVEIDSNTLSRYSDVVLRLISYNNILKAFSIKEKLTRYEEIVDIDSRLKFIRAEIGCYKDPYSLEPNKVDELLALGNPIYIS
jgi:hypothetical protein